MLNIFRQLFGVGQKIRQVGWGLQLPLTTRECHLCILVNSCSIA